MRLARHLRHDCAGSTVVEFALTLPVLLALVIGLMEVAWLGWAKVTLDYATAEAARCGAVRQDLCGTTAQIQAYGASMAKGLNINASSFTVTQAACGLQVSASAGAGFVSYVLPSALSKLSAQVCRS